MRHRGHQAIQPMVKRLMDTLSHQWRTAAVDKPCTEEQKWKAVTGVRLN